MAERDYSKYQQKAIKRFYDNRPQLDEQRLAELVTDLYLSEGKKSERLWESVPPLMERLGVPKSRMEHILSSKDPAILAEVVKDIQQGNIRPPKKAASTAKNSEKSE